MVSDMPLSVLLLGETGTGKEVVARLLHHTSTRREKRFIKLNCAALPGTLLESELFGYEKGAFTGADRMKPGKFELASDGVIFLDEIGDMPSLLQPKILQVLQSGEFNRLGGIEDLKVNAWVVSSTNHDLDEDMKQGRFREDLYYRLNVIKIEMPALRDRREDIPLLTEYFVRKNQTELKMDEDFILIPELKDLFQAYHWPGNVRELSSTVTRLMVGEDPEDVKYWLLNNMAADDLAVPIETITEYGDEQKLMDNEDLETMKPLKELRSEATEFIEKKTILYALNKAEWNKSEVARMLKISYKSLFNKMDKLGIDK